MSCEDSFILERFRVDKLTTHYEVAKTVFVYSIQTVNKLSFLRTFSSLLSREVPVKAVQFFQRGKSQIAFVEYERNQRN